MVPIRCNARHWGAYAARGIALIALVSRQWKPAEQREVHDDPTNQANDIAPSPKPIPEHDGPDAHETGRQRHRNKKPALDNVDERMALWTGVVGVFTIFIAVIGGFQAWAFVQSERSYLIVEDVKFVNSDFTISPNQIIIVTIKNVGKHIVSIKELQPMLRIGALHAPKFAANFPSMHRIVEPDQSSIAQLIYSASPNDAIKYYGAISSGRMPFYVYGRIIYNGGFGVFGNGKTGFCYRYIPTAQRVLTPFQFVPCDNNPAYQYEK